MQRLWYVANKKAKSKSENGCKWSKSSKNENQRNDNEVSQNNICKRCDQIRRHKCPDLKAVCKNGHKNLHFAELCYYRNIRYMNEQDWGLVFSTQNEM